ncbi:MAG TPA: hypothetical protein DCX01_03965 [Bacteroidetes bacterium]|nr:hypothetical protein [Bacteroidota bacterium]
MKYILPIILLLFSCASVQQLDGGDKDITPPQVQSVFPDSASLNVKSKIISFTFDEYISTTKTNELLIISPSQKINPTIESKGKKLIITLNDSLLPNTTYTIQFNRSVIDINESNPLINYNYIFSTGSYLDSLNIQGLVKDIISNQPCDGCNVHLYKTINDSLVLTDKPDYITKTTEDGTYTFRNLPASIFNILSLNDDNKNLKLDKDETISLSKVIHSDSNSIDTLLVFPNQNNDPYKLILTTKKIPGILQLVSNKPILKDSLVLLLKDSATSYNLSLSKDTITTYFKPTSDTTGIRIYLLSDTFEFKYILDINNLKYTPKLSASTSQTLLYIISNTPIQSIDTSKIFLYADSQIVKIDKYTINGTTSILHTNTKINNKQLKLILTDGAILDLLNKTNKVDTILIQPNLESISSLALTLNLLNTQYYIISLKQVTKTISQHYITSDTTLNFKNIIPGTYKIEIITDTNHNNIWDTGDFLSKRSPELIQLSNDIEIRQNWDKELIINVQ